MKLKRLLILLSGLLLQPAQALAAETYWVYDEADVAASALQRVALMFSDNSLTSIAVAFGMAGLVVGAIMVLGQMGSGRPVNPVSFIYPFLLGGLLLAAIITPKDDVIVRDEVRGTMITVADVPAALAKTLGWLSEAKKAVIDLIDTSAPPGSALIWSYKNNANGLTFDLLMRSMIKSGTITNTYLDASLKKYNMDCLSWAIDVPASTLNLDELNSGNVDMMDQLAKAASPTVNTVYYTSAAPSGTVMSCEDAWTNISAILNAAPGNAKEGQTMFENMIYSVCDDHGFVTSLRNSTSQFLDPNALDSKCKQLYAESVYAAIGENNAPPWTAGGSEAWKWMRHMFLSRKVMEWASSADPTELGNYYQVLDRVGWTQQAAQWMPMVRSGLFAFAIAIIPLSMLFLMTGAGLRALAFPMGMILFVIIWEIVEAISHSYMMEWAFRSFSEAIQHQTGLIGMAMLAPTSMKVMSAFGTMRVLSASLALSFMYIVFRYGGMAIASIGSSFAASAQQHGTESMRKTTDPIEHGNMLKALASSSATYAGMNSVGGFSNYGASMAFQNATNAQTQFRTMGATGGMSGAGEIASTNAAEVGGGVTAFKNAGGTNGDGYKNLEAGSNARMSYKLGAGEEYRKQSGGDPTKTTELGMEVGSQTAASEISAAQMNKALMNATGKSMSEFFKGKHGANMTQSMSPEQMKSFLASSGMGANMDPELRKHLETNGGTLTASLDDGGNMVSFRVSTGKSGEANNSQKIDESTVKDHGVRSSEGPQADSMAAAANNHDAMHKKAEDMIEAGLKSDDIGKVRQGAELWAKQLQDEKGIQTGAGVQESGQSSMTGRASIGGDTPIPGVSAGASYQLADTRQDSGTSNTSGYMNFVNQSADQMMERYKEARANGIDADTAAGLVADDYLDGAAPMWVDNMAQRAYGAAEGQTDALQSRSGGEIAAQWARKEMEDAEKAIEKIGGVAGDIAGGAENVVQKVEEVGEKARQKVEEIGDAAEKSTLDTLLNLSHSMGGGVKPRE